MRLQSYHCAIPLSGAQSELMGALELEKNWIFGGYTSVFECTAEISNGDFSDLVDGCLRKTLPNLFTSSNTTELIDFKGRNPQDELLPGLPTASKDELFRVGGSCALQEIDGDFIWDDFDLCCYSPFARFDGTHHVVHSIENQRTGSLPHWLPARLIGCAVPITLSYFRLGLEHYRSKRSFISLGYNPQVSESILIDCDAGKLRIRITIDSQRRVIEDPFEGLAPLKMIADILTRTASIDIQREYMSALRERW